MVSNACLEDLLIWPQGKPWPHNVDVTMLTFTLTFSYILRERDAYVSESDTRVSQVSL